MSKFSTHKARFQKPTDPSSKRRGQKRFTGLHWTLVILGLMLLGVSVLAVFEFVIWARVPPALAGTWQVREGPAAATFEFFRNGTLQVRVNSQKQSPSRVSVVDRTMFTSVMNPNTLREETRKSTILELTADSLVLELEDGNVMKMSRVK